MKNEKRRFRREIYAIVIVKLIVITAIWWVFFSDARVAVDSDAASLHLFSKQTHENKSVRGELND